jgi:hypothetical protein
MRSAHWRRFGWSRGPPPSSCEDWRAVSIWLAAGGKGVDRLLDILLDEVHEGGEKAANSVRRRDDMEVRSSAAFARGGHWEALVLQVLKTRSCTMGEKTGTARDLSATRAEQPTSDQIALTALFRSRMRRIFSTRRFRPGLVGDEAACSASALRCEAVPVVELHRQGPAPCENGPSRVGSSTSLMGVDAEGDFLRRG